MVAARFAKCLAVPVLVVCSAGVAAGQEVPLVDAARKADIAAVRALVRQRVDINGPGSDGATALHWAVHNDNLELTDVLLRAGANVNAANRYGATPLSLACINGSARAVGMLRRMDSRAGSAIWVASACPNCNDIRMAAFSVGWGESTSARPKASATGLQVCSGSG